MPAHESTDLAAMKILEAAAAANLLDYVRALPAVGFPGASIRAAGGVVAFAGLDSPLTTVKGAGPEIGDRDIDAAEEFFRSHQVHQAIFELAPWVSQDTIERLARRHYTRVGMEDVVARFDALTAPPDTTHRIERLAASQWPGLMLAMNENTGGAIWRSLAEASARLPGVVSLAVLDGDGCQIACGQLAPAAEAALFANDATHPQARGRGAQTALIHHRLRIAAELGMACVAAEVAPESTSERNYLRCGFQRVYARSHWARQLA